jgi:hypothetical protein
MLVLAWDGEMSRSVSHFCSARCVEDKWNCGWGVPHGTVSRLPLGKGLMFRTFGHSFFLLFLIVCAVQLLGMACSDDGLRQWSTSPVHAHDQLPGSPEGQTEPDQGKGELEELALAQGEAFRIIHFTQICIVDHASCPRTDFASDLFRPPARP